MFWCRSRQTLKAKPDGICKTESSFLDGKEKVVTPKEVLALCREKDVKAVDLRFMDFPGLWQHFTIPVAKLDEDVFEDSEVFDIERQKAGAHLAFGSGPHHCPGAALARQEMFSAFTILLHRLENIRLKDPDDPFEHVPSSFLRGLAHLNIEFDVRNPERYLPDASAF